jgi:23S rRNA pseudouridine2605 synthase
MEVRLQKFLAEAGIASRRKSEELILKGKVQVNGVTVTELGTKVDDKLDTVTFNGKRVGEERHVYIMLNKPEGFVTTAKDQFDRPTVMDLIKGVKERVVPVGRLDYDTSGLLLLTNDGDLTFKLTHPSKKIEKTYLAKLFGKPTDENIKEFAEGIEIDTGKTHPAKIEIIEDLGKYCLCNITITEGKNRQVRKMCDAIKHPVATLKRVGTGKLNLGDLKKGTYRYLTDSEVKYLKSL